MSSLRFIALAAAGLAASSAVAQSPPVPNQPALFTGSAPVKDSRTDVRQISAPATKPNVVVLRPNSACYTLRTYQFEKTTPGSDANKLSSQSTCVPARTSGAVAVIRPR